MIINTDTAFILWTHENPSNCVAALASIIRSTNAYPRIVVVDTGKKIKIDALLERYRKAGYSIYAISKPSGGAWALNKAIEKIHSFEPLPKYIAWLTDTVELTKPWEEVVYRYLSNGKIFAVGVEGFQVYPDLEGFKMSRVVKGKTCQYLSKDFWVYKRQEKPLLIPEFFKGRNLYGEAYLQFKMQAEGLRLGVLDEGILRYKPNEKVAKEDTKKTFKFFQDEFLGKLDFTKKKEKKSDSEYIHKGKM